MGIVEKATVTGPSARTSSPLRRVDSIFVRLTRRLHYPYTRCERNSHSEFSLMNIRSSGPVPRILRNSRGTRPVNSILTFHPFFRPDSFVASRQARFNHRDTLPVTTLPPIECWILFLSLSFFASNTSTLLPDFRIPNLHSRKENQLENSYYETSYSLPIKGYLEEER